MLAINFVFDKLTSILPCNEFEITATPMIIRDEPSYPIRGLCHILLLFVLGKVFIFINMNAFACQCKGVVNRAL